MTRNQLTTCDLDFSPLFKSMIGFDRMAQMLEKQNGTTNAYPPYNIEKLNENAYRISMALAGFGQDDLDITVQDLTLIVRGEKSVEDNDEGSAYLHRGIATRSFEQRFSLAEHVEVKDAHMQDGMLLIELVREVPERLKPRKIEVKQGLFDKAKQAISNKKAA